MAPLLLEPELSRTSLALGLSLASTGASSPHLPPLEKPAPAKARVQKSSSNHRLGDLLVSDVNTTLASLLRAEDTDENHQITVEDTGPKRFRLPTVASAGTRSQDVQGTYRVSNLLQELTLAQRAGRRSATIPALALHENPVERLKHAITSRFWLALTRKFAANNASQIAADTKMFDVTPDGPISTIRVYVPAECPEQYEYFKAALAAFGFEVCYLPEKLDADTIFDLNSKPGLLILAGAPDPEHGWRSEPYIVPGGRFNEFYGWDSYMTVLGLLQSPGNLHICRGMTNNFAYEITHYGKILNANRLYYLGRSQPPFLTDMAWRVYAAGGGDAQFLYNALKAAVKEYETVWCAPPRLDLESGLSCYHPEGKGVPPETEEGHFDEVLQPYAQTHGLLIPEFVKAYNAGSIAEPDLDEYFLHDRAVRELGHDTTYRLEGQAAHLATVDLNSLLYKYEVDIVKIIDTLEQQGLASEFDSAVWRERAEKRKERITKYLWNEEDSIFYDYNIKTKKQNKFVSATCVWPLWAGAALQEQADLLVKNSLGQLEEHGGLVSGTKASRDTFSMDGPLRQWDYPNGWAPHQMLAWEGLSRYGYSAVARRLAYRWLLMMLHSFVNYNGVVVEKYNVVDPVTPHKVDAEYGNQGVDFSGVASEGFGWVNASFLVGLTYLDKYGERCLGAMVPPEVMMEQASEKEKKAYGLL